MGVSARRFRVCYKNVQNWNQKHGSIYHKKIPNQQRIWPDTKCCCHALCVRDCSVHFISDYQGTDPSPSIEREQEAIECVSIDCNAVCVCPSAWWSFHCRRRGGKNSVIQPIPLARYSVINISLSCKWLFYIEFTIVIPSYSLEHCSLQYPCVYRMATEFTNL
jgi:hypothetical protein